MITFIEKRKNNLPFRILSFFIMLAFGATLVLPPNLIYAQNSVNLPPAGAMVSLTPSFQPALMKGITINPNNPLQFEFLIDQGERTFSQEELKEEGSKLIKYFLASLTVPDEDQWVNLSPYEENRIIADSFAQTEMGRDLLAQDYLLKQITSSLIYPEDELGQKFWNRVKDKVQEKYGTTELPMDTFNKVWIVPDVAVVFEKGYTAFVADSRLKVMLEEDYLAAEKNNKTSSAPWAMGHAQNHEKKRTAHSAQHTAEVRSLSSEMMRELIIPEIEKEVNQGQNFAQLRQIYHAMILATWFKQNLQQSLLGQVYVDQAKIKGINLKDKSAKDKIYQHYLEAYQKGVYNYIKEDYDPRSRQAIPRKYFSGGFDRSGLPENYQEVEGDLAMLTPGVREDLDATSAAVVGVDLAAAGADSDEALLASEIGVFAQRITREAKSGTGQVNGDAAIRAGANGAMAGHSEARQDLGDTDADVADQLQYIHELGFKDKIFAFGEPEKVRKQGNPKRFVKGQILEGLKKLTPEQVAETIFAYEPIWAIGTGLTASPTQVQTMAKYIRDVIREEYGDEIANKIRILYGGSVNPGNAAQLIALEDVDGFLIGGASNQVEDITAIIKAVEAQGPTDGRIPYVGGNNKTKRIATGFYTDVAAALADVDSDRVQVGFAPSVALISEAARAFGLVDSALLTEPVALDARLNEMADTLEGNQYGKVQIVPVSRKADLAEDDPVERILARFRGQEGITDEYLANAEALLRAGALGGTGHLMFLPIDQEIEHDPYRTFVPNPDSASNWWKVQRAYEVGMSGYAGPVGAMREVAPVWAPYVPLIAKINNSTSDGGNLKPNQHSAISGNIAELAALGVRAIGITIYPGSGAWEAQKKEAEWIIAEAKKYGLPTIIWSYPRGTTLTKAEETAFDVELAALKEAHELGAFIVKIKPPGGVIRNERIKAWFDEQGVSYETLADRLAIIRELYPDLNMVFSGGGAKGDDLVLDEVAGLLLGGRPVKTPLLGALGHIMGRNHFQRDRAGALDLVLNIYAMNRVVDTREWSGIEALRAYARDVELPRVIEELNLPEEAPEYGPRVRPDGSVDETVYERAVEELLAHDHMADSEEVKAKMREIYNHGRLAGTGNLLVVPHQEGVAVNEEVSAITLLAENFREVSARLNTDVPLVAEVTSADVFDQENPDGYYDQPDIRRQIKEAAANGASAIGFRLRFGATGHNSYMAQLRGVIDRAREAGLPVLVLSTPRSEDNEKLPSAHERSLDVVTSALAVGFHTGAQFVSVPLPRGEFLVGGVKKVLDDRGIKYGTQKGRMALVKYYGAFGGERQVPVLLDEQYGSRRALLRAVGASLLGGGNGFIVGENSDIMSHPQWVSDILAITEAASGEQTFSSVDELLRAAEGADSALLVEATPLEGARARIQEYVDQLRPGAVFSVADIMRLTEVSSPQRVQTEMAAISLRGGVINLQNGSWKKPEILEGTTTDRDPSQLGGIDFTKERRNIQIQRDGNGVPLPMDLQPVDALLENVQGFRHTIIYIKKPQPMPLILGLGNNVDGQPKTTSDDRPLTPAAFLKEDHKAKDLELGVS